MLKNKASDAFIQANIKNVLWHCDVFCLNLETLVAAFDLPDCYPFYGGIARRGRDEIIAKRRISFAVSIHAPAGGGATAYHAACSATDSFNPRARGGGATAYT
jgi:hypothetical protein